MRTISEPLRQNCPGKLAGYLFIWVLLSKYKQMVRVWIQRDGKKGILEVEDRKVRGIRWNVRGEIVRIGYHAVDGNHHFIDLVGGPPPAGTSHLPS